MPSRLICEKCAHHFLLKDLADQYRCSINLVDMRLTQFPEYFYKRTYIKKIDLSAEPSDLKVRSGPMSL